jgi:endo-1,4-beta-xylanase
MAFDAFISYSSNDKAAADATCAVLERAGIRCWIAPRDIRTGAEYGGAIIEAIDHCRVMILVFSSSANASRQIHREIERAVSKGVPILPVRIEEVVPTKSMEYFLGSIHWLDALSPPLEQHLHKLADTVNAMLKVDGAPAGRAASDATEKLADSPAIETIERPTWSVESVKPPAAAARLAAEKPSRPKWLLPIGSAALVALIAAGGVWLYRADVLAPAKVPAPANAPVSPPAGPAAATTLRASAQARNFSIGAGGSAGWLRNDSLFSQTLAREYNVMAGGTQTWFSTVRTSPTEFKFADADTVYDFAAANGMQARPNPLLAGDVPSWLAKGNFSPTEITAILKEFVQTVVRRYRGRVMAWDVSWGMFDMLGKENENFWSKAVGDDYIAQIIAWAHEADPQAKLFLNSNYAFDVVGPRSNAVYDLLQKFRARGVAVDGIALANTILLDQLPKLQDFVTNMSRLAALGLEIHLVEFEVSIKVPPSEQDLQRQAAVYRDYLNTCLSFPSCKLFATGGLSDNDAYAPKRWPGKGVGAAMPFDELYRPKPAYKAMLDVLNRSQSTARQSQ